METEAERLSDLPEVAELGFEPRLGLRQPSGYSLLTQSTWVGAPLGTRPPRFYPFHGEEVFAHLCVWSGMSVVPVWTQRDTHVYAGVMGARGLRWGL